ncbi:MAG: response regulator [archaeon]|nr:response regulator [archaeon]
MSETQAKILVIDDEKSIRITLKKLLEKENYYVETARDYQTAKQNIENLNFDLMIVDLVLPKINGIDIVKHFYEDYGIDVPVIFLTGEPNLDSAIDALRIGAFDYIEKPIQKSELINIIEYALNRKKSEDAAKVQKLEGKIKKKLKEFQQNVQSRLLTTLNENVSGLRKNIEVLKEQKPENLSKKYQKSIDDIERLITNLENEVKKANHLGAVVESMVKN